MCSIQPWVYGEVGVRLTCLLCVESAQLDNVTGLQDFRSLCLQQVTQAIYNNIIIPNITPRAQATRNTTKLCSPPPPRQKQCHMLCTFLIKENRHGWLFLRLNTGEKLSREVSLSELNIWRVLIQLVHIWHRWQSLTMCPFFYYLVTGQVN